MTFIGYKWMVIAKSVVVFTVLRHSLVIAANFLMIIDSIPIITYHRYFLLTFMSVSVRNSLHRVEENSKMTFNIILYLILYFNNKKLQTVLLDSQKLISRDITSAVDLKLRMV